MKAVKCARCKKCYFEYKPNDKCPFCKFDPHSIAKKGEDFSDYLFDFFKKNSKGGK